ncbi:MAG: endonuclease [Sulfuricurvum sp. PC08-66]|nr:MAG: endonuclease [Sulfuricurvum sp. PC08-66]
MSYTLYVLRCNDDTLYTGITTDIEKRLHEHNHTDKGAKYTKSRRPVTLLYAQACEDKSDALRREYALKQLSRLKKLEFIKENLINTNNWN